MELKDFVSTVLVSIVKGVEEAQEDLSHSEAIINPEGLKSKIDIQRCDEDIRMQ
ncbi:MAG: hypothetical protein U5L00_04325 [Desulfovermiculus sp.]|nr:hypothetical protein [Desulfovermiculus sp.]